MERPEVDTPAHDVVMRYLIGVRLAETESDFRAILENVADESSEPKLRDLVIATVGILMTLGGNPWPRAMTVINHLRTRPDEVLKDDGIAIVNGERMILPTGGPGSQDVLVLDLATMRPSRATPPAFVSTVYSCSAIWDEAERILTQG